ncbi:MAG TPA: gliding motility-associated C-terminal domain-containing protein [Paludibacteraceae bacterium]|nr:gliding motility-associated C-terminal domain-containing protein [Paludibacteraceae bacterium]
MKKIILLISLLNIFFQIEAQFSAIGKYVSYTNFVGIDELFIFYEINSDTEIIYNGSGNVIWYKFDNPTDPISNLPSIYPEDATGYILKTDNETKTIWVIDYQKYLPVFYSINVENAPEEQCNELNLSFDAMVPELYYYAVNGIYHKIPRNFTLIYRSLEWNDGWKEIEKSKNIILPSSNLISIPSPLCDTYFIIQGDQFAQDLNLDNFTFQSSLYSVLAMECHIKTTVTTRNEKNEAERPSVASILEGSSPLDMLLTAEVNQTNGVYYDWNIYKDKELLANRKDAEHRYTFNKAGIYQVYLTVNNGSCSATDSIVVTVSESKLEVPNVFTPNGDGINDEFRVAYQSLTQFEAWIYNRWGRLVYHWNDPQKGWDGTIGRKEAAEGPYFYIIKAVGADGKKYLKKGDINLLRGKKE